MTSSLIPDVTSPSSLDLKVRDLDKIGVLLVYNPPHGTTTSLPDPTEFVLETPRLNVLGDFNIHAEAVLSGVSRDVMISMGLSKWHLDGY